MPRVLGEAAPARALFCSCLRSLALADITSPCVFRRDSGLIASALSSTLATSVESRPSWTRFRVRSFEPFAPARLTFLRTHDDLSVSVCVGDKVPWLRVSDGGREPAAAWVSRASLSVSCASFTRSGHSGRSAVYLVVSCVESRAVGDRVMQFVIYNFKSNVLQKSPGLNVVAEGRATGAGVMS